MFQFGFNVFPEMPRPFNVIYQCFSVAMIPGNERQDVEKGGKIIMPPSALEQLTRLNINYPMLFKLTNKKTSRQTHCGVLEFIADEGKCYLPLWMMNNLILEEGDALQIESVNLPVGTFSKFQPLNPDFLDITNPKAVLENCLRTFACLTTGDVIAVRYNEKAYELCVLETKPQNAISIIECDMNVEFAAPVGYKEPVIARKDDDEMAFDPADLMPEPTGFVAFGGAGNRLDGKRRKDSTSHEVQPSKAPYVRGIPDYDYQPGFLRFIRIKPEKPSTSKEEKADEPFQPFKGSGKSLSVNVILCCNKEKMDNTPNTECPSTPGQSAIVAMKELNKEVAFKIPFGSVKRKKKQKVLDEDRFIEELGNIIERDFFPDLEKLKAKTEYLDAVEKNDVIKIRELHLKYTGSKEVLSRLPSPATFETPANIHNSQQDVEEPATPSSTHIADQDDKVHQLSLDQYLNCHTSEDNQSFEEIMEESDRKHRQKYSYLYKEENKSLNEQHNMLELPSIEQQAALPSKPLNIDTWGYKNKNFIMYVPDGVPLTPEEEIEHNKKRQEVVHVNTRLHINPFNDTHSKEAITELARKQSHVLDGKIGVDGKELLTNTPKVRGFGLVRTPSPCPGVAESPLMTWGEVEGTPFRLDGSDTPLVRSQGPSFKINAPPKREQLGMALAEKASERHRDKKKKAMDAARRQFASPSPYTGSSRERLFNMSPAAQKLAVYKLRIPGALTPSPRTPRIMKTPGFSPRRTPGGAQTPNKTPKLNLGIRKSDNTLTDDLLQIQVPRRQTASDFF